LYSPTGTDTRILDAQEIAYRETADRIFIDIASTLEAIPIIEKCKSHIKGFEVTAGTMDEAFIGITGKEIRE
jgi:multidrug/hemolysin transport system ATP-binding protein